MTKFLVVGSMNFDMTYVIEGRLEPHSKTRAKEMWAGPGGSASNTAYLLGRRRLAVRILGAVGKDVVAPELLTSLESQGVDTAHVQESSRAQTATCVILLAGTDKQMVSFPGANANLDLNAVATDIFDDISHIHVASGRADIVSWALSHALRIGATSSLEWNGRDYAALEQGLDVSFMNQDELRRLHAGDEPQEVRAASLARRTGGLVVITAGARGAWAVDPAGQRTSAPARPVKIIDRTGGGDGFNAGFLAAWKYGAGLQKALAVGLDLAAEVLETRGTRPL